MITVRDQITGKDVSMNLVGNAATLCCGSVWLTETIRPADLSMAKVALSKRDLDAFGSFFDNPKTERRAA